jgi:hypothetical protein
MLNIDGIKNSQALSRLKRDLNKSLEPLIPYWQKVQPILNKYYLMFVNRYYAWDKKNRIMFFVGIIIVVLLFWDLFFYAPITKESRIVSNNIISTKQSIETAKKDKEVFLRSIKDNPNQILQGEIEKIEQDTAILKKDILAFSENQTSTSKMIQIIKNKISQEDKIKLIKIAGVTSMRVIPPSLGTTRIGLENLPNIYENPIELEFESDYFTTIKFLMSLEQSWRIFWDNVVYSVLIHPNARVSVRLHLLSTGEGWNEV